METVKKHWKQIAVGAALAGVAYIAYSYSKQSQKQPVEVEVDGKTWPQFRDVIDITAPEAEQQKQFDDWIEKVLKKFVTLHGAFKVNAQNNLEEEDFIQIYDLIESVARFNLHQLRKTNEVRRKTIFESAFPKQTT